MARRRYQKGSLIQRGKREKVWVGRFLEDEFVAGSQQRKHRSIVLGTLKELPTRKLAQRKLDEHLAKVNSILYKPTHKLTFRDLAEKWRKTAMPTHKPSSQSSELAHLVRLNEFFGDMDARLITGETVQRFVNSSSGAPRTIKNTVTTLRMIWKAAYDWGYVERDERSILRSVRLPEIGSGDQPILDPSQARQIIAAADEPFKTMFWIVAETGIRGGELCGLSVDDLDLNNQILSVRRSAYRGTIQTPKTRNAIRTFVLSDNLALHLRDYMRTWRDNPDRLLFATRANTPYVNQNVVACHLHPLMDQLGIPRPKRIGLHALRHGAASVLDQHNVPIAVRRDRMGHSSFATTLIYTHADPKDHRHAAQILGPIFDPSLPKPDTAPAQSIA